MNLAFTKGNTFFHRADPITKFAWAILIAFWVYGIRDLSQVILIDVLTTALVVIAAKVSLTQYLKLSIPMLAGGSFIILYQGFFQPGVGISIWGITFSYVGITLGITITLRVFTMVATALAYSTTTSPQDMENALIRLKMPYRLARVLYLALRFIPSFSQDFEALLAVHKNRGIKPTMKSITKGLIAFVATELRHAEELPAALETRGFGLHPTRTELTDISITKEGVLLLVGTICVIITQLLYSTL